MKWAVLGVHSVGAPEGDAASVGAPEEGATSVCAQEGGAASGTSNVDLVLVLLALLLLVVLLLLDGCGASVGALG